MPIAQPYWGRLRPGNGRPTLPAHEGLGPAPPDRATEGLRPGDAWHLRTRAAIDPWFGPERLRPAHVRALRPRHPARRSTRFGRSRHLGAGPRRGDRGRAGP